MKRFFAFILVSVMLCSLTACQERNLQQNPPSSNSQVQPNAEDIPPAQPENQPDAEELPPQTLPAPDSQPVLENKTEIYQEVLPETPKEVSEEKSSLLVPANPAAVSDFSSYASLDSTKLGWGPGGPVDELNRSQGALAYQQKYGNYDADFIGENSNKIYLTFDQGYENGCTTPILDVLKEKNCPAVFFLTGHYVNTQPELIQRMIDEGHTLGNHSNNHPSFPDTPLEKCKEEVESIHNTVKEQFGYEMSLFRFPAGEFSEKNLKLLQDMGYRSVFWSFAYRDWEVDNQPDPVTAKETIISKTHNGAIILLHSVSSTNAQILGEVIDELRAKGFEFASYEENLALMQNS